MINERNVCPRGSVCVWFEPNFKGDHETFSTIGQCWEIRFLSIRNNTSHHVSVYQLPGCRGLSWDLPPWSEQGNVNPEGQSFRINP
jgi:hypothetical protein